MGSKLYGLRLFPIFAVLIGTLFAGLSPSSATSSTGYALRPMSAASCTDSLISCGTTRSGSLDTTDCIAVDKNYYDVWAFQGTAGQTVTIDMTSSAFDTYLFLFNPAGVFVDGNDDYGTSNSHLVHKLTATGTWRMWATSAGAYATGGYSLKITCIDLGSPNLVPYKPSAWSDRIVVSTTSKTFVDSTDLANKPLYIDWAVANVGVASTDPGIRYYTELLIDGVVKTRGYSDDVLQPNFYAYWEYFLTTPLTVGTHTIQVRADSTDIIFESNETDNDYTKTITVGTVTPPTPTPTPTRPPPSATPTPTPPIPTATPAAQIQGNGSSTTNGWFAFVGRVAGAFDSLFRTDLWLFNPDPVNFSIATLLFHSQGGAEFSKSISLAPRETRLFPDVTQRTLAASDGQVGALEWQSTAPLMGGIAVYTDGPGGGTFGFGVPAIAFSRSMAPKTSATDTESALQLFAINSGDPNFRVNLDVTNTSNTIVPIEVRVIDPMTNAVYGGAQTYTIPPRSLLRVGRILEIVGAPLIEGLRITVAIREGTVLTGGGGIIAVATTLDNRTNDGSAFVGQTQ